MSIRKNRRWPLGVRNAVIFPARSHPRTASGVTLKRAATSPIVSRSDVSEEGTSPNLGTT